MDDGRKLVFEISDGDYKALKKFQKKHENCIYKYPNMTGAIFEYSFSPDGMGCSKSVTCVCGANISLWGQYDPDGEPIEHDHNYPIFQVVSDDEKAAQLARTLLAMKVRPGMYFGKHRSLMALRSYIVGFEQGVSNMKSDALNESTRYLVVIKVSRHVRSVDFAVTPVANCQGFVVPLLAFASCRITRFSLSFTVWLPFSAK